MRSDQRSRAATGGTLQISSTKACLRVITEIFLWLWQEGQPPHEAGSWHSGNLDLSMEVKILLCMLHECVEHEKQHLMPSELGFQGYEMLPVYLQNYFTRDGKSITSHYAQNET